MTKTLIFLRMNDLGRGLHYHNIYVTYGVRPRWCRDRDVLTKPGNIAAAAKGTNTCCDRFDGCAAFRTPVFADLHTHARYHNIAKGSTSPVQYRTL